MERDFCDPDHEIEANQVCTRCRRSAETVVPIPVIRIADPKRIRAKIDHQLFLSPSPAAAPARATLDNRQKNPEHLYEFR